MPRVHRIEVGVRPGLPDPRSDAVVRGAGIVGMLVYNACVALYFLWLGIQGEWVGQFLWPAVAVHTVMTAWNAWDFARGRGDGEAAAGRG